MHLKLFYFDRQRHFRYIVTLDQEEGPKEKKWNKQKHCYVHQYALIEKLNKLNTRI